MCRATDLEGQIAVVIGNFGEAGALSRTVATAVSGGCTVGRSGIAAVACVASISGGCAVAGITGIVALGITEVDIFSHNFGGTAVVAVLILPLADLETTLGNGHTALAKVLADELCRDYLAIQDETADKNDLTALFNIGYGLYVVTSNDGHRHNGLIVNTVTQVTNTPNRIAVTINKQNYSHHVIKQTGIMNINCLSVDAPFKVFENFGFRSGRNTDKFEGVSYATSDNGLAFLTTNINSFMSLKVESYVDLDTHGMFICSITESRVISNLETMTYTYYQNNVKPKPQTDKKGYVCKICGWVYEGDTLPDDIVCPLCKHGAADFEEIK